MSNTLAILDLHYLQFCFTDRITAGFANAYTDTTVGAGYADATAIAIARGQRTATNTWTLARVETYGGMTFSLADAQASAYASTDNNSHRAWSNSTSIGFSSTSSSYTSVGG